jgi:23S rRNA pseudouridine1911/1915/1917 synthase
MAVLPGGKQAKTTFVRLARFDSVDLVRAHLHSGRTHQIRVHLAHDGWPLVGDRLYGGAPALGIERQALHAHELAFTHPGSGAKLSFRAPPPSDFAHAWDEVVAAGGP